MFEVNDSTWHAARNRGELDYKAQGAAARKAPFGKTKFCDFYFRGSLWIRSRRAE